MRNIKLGIVILIFFLGANVLSTIGVDNTAFQYFILLIAIFPFLSEFKGERFFYERRFEILILVLIVVMMLNRLRAGMLQDSIRNATILFITPFLFLLIPRDIRTKKDYKFLKAITKILIVFYILECSIAIIEFVFKIHVFVWVDTVFESNLGVSRWDSFRSVSMHGAPLTNALLITILNAFFTTSRSINSKYKFLLWITGFVAVLAFNARMAIFINIFLFLVQIFKLARLKRLSISKKMITYFVISLFIPVIFYLVVYKGWGDRLFTNELLDKGSGQVRLDVFSVFDHVTFSNLLMGYSMKSFESVKDFAGLLIIENFWICLVLLFGLVFVIFLVIFYYKLMRVYLKEYSFTDGAIVTLCFILLASTNNSLFTQYIPLFLFLLCLNVFRPEISGYLLPRKFVKS